MYPHCSPHVGACILFMEALPAALVSVTMQLHRVHPGASHCTSVTHVSCSQQCNWRPKWSWSFHPPKLRAPHQLSLGGSPGNASSRTRTLFIIPACPMLPCLTFECRRRKSWLPITLQLQASAVYSLSFSGRFSLCRYSQKYGFPLSSFILLRLCLV